MANRQPHHASHMARADVTEVATGHSKVHLLSVVLGRLEISGKVVHHLRQHTGPGDRVDCPNFVMTCESQIIGDGLDDVLAVIEHAFDGDVVDVLVQQTEHLRLLKWAHASMRTGHEHTHALFAAHGVLSRTASIAGCGAQNVQSLASPCELVLKQVTQQLHGHVFEGKCRPIGQGF